MKLKEMRAETLTLVLVNLAGIMESADESLLPGVYKEVGADLHIGPTGLGFLTLFRSMVQASCYPIAVYLSVRHNRAHVIALGTFLWAAATFLVAFSSTFLERNGAYRPIPGRITATPSHHNSLRYRDRYRDFEPCAIVTPAIESLVADSTDDSNRGMAFGWLQFTREIGSIIGGVSSVLLASTSTSFMGIPGWRIAFHLVGIISVIVGILVGRFAQDPHFSYSDEAKTQKPKKVKDLFKEAKSVLKIPSFQIIVAQGVSGSFPGKALSFGPMWLELIGFSHKTTALLWTLFVMAYAVGGLFGGKMGDILAQRLPNAGRIINSGTDKLWFYYSVSSDSAAGIA